eukprot:scaffold804_cov85-Skeletonema_dohrnii-CCMP3373.AAC.5
MAWDIFSGSPVRAGILLGLRKRHFGRASHRGAYAQSRGRYSDGCEDIFQSFLVWTGEPMQTRRFLLRLSILDRCRWVQTVMR